MKQHLPSSKQWQKIELWLKYKADSQQTVVYSTSNHDKVWIINHFWTYLSEVDKCYAFFIYYVLMIYEP